MDPIVLISSEIVKSENSPLAKHLMSQAEQMGGQFVNLDKLYEENGIKPIKMVGGLGGKGKYDHSESIAELGQKLQINANGRRVVIMIDEIAAYNAPKDDTKTTYNWAALEKVTGDVMMILVVNPGLSGTSEGPMLLPNSCIHIHLPVTYRSTQSISNLYSCIIASKRYHVPLGKPGTEVVGDLPKLIVLGNLGNGAESAKKIRNGLKLMRSQFGEQENEVTVITDGTISKDLIDRIKLDVKEWGWKVMKAREMFGAEADRVVVVGSGAANREAMSRARISLGVILCCQNEFGAGDYNSECNGYRAAIERGLVEVATPPWDLQVASSVNFGCGSISCTYPWQ